MRRSFFCFLFSVGFAGLFFGVAFGGAEELVPETTKGLFVMPDTTTIEASWDEIELGKLAKDPEVKPFMDDLQKQIQERLDKTGVRVGVSLEEFFDVCTGELAVAFIEPRKGAQKHALASIADVKGKESEIAEMREKIKKTMTGRKAKLQTETVNGVELDVYTVPIKIGGRKTFQAVFFTTADKVVAVDHVDVAKEILALIQGGDGKTLKSVKGYSATMERVVKESDGLEPHMHWWVEPIAYAKLTREAAAIQKRRRWDVLGAASAQGFECIRGLGGHMNLDAKLADGSHYDLLWRVYCYAPPVKGAGSDRYKDTARLLSKAGSDELIPEDFVADDIGTYATGTWEIQESYEFIGSLVDEIAGEPGFFDDLKASLKEDPSGPMIDLDKDIVAHLGTRATVMTDCLEPITPESERFMVAISLANAGAMKKTLAKILAGDPNARLLEVDDEEIWEIINEDIEAPVVAVEGGDFAAFDEEDEDDGGGGGGALMGNAAMSVIKGHLLISSHADFIVEVMRRKKKAAKLADAEDYGGVQEALAKVGSTPKDTMRAFSRVDEELKATYEFIRDGQMPQSKGLLGRALNQLLNDEEEEGPRKQQINGKKMPKYEVVRKRLGPIGAYIIAEDDGFYGAGVGMSRADAISGKEEEAGGAAEISTAKREE